jgi:hypothetical protein
MDEMILVPSLMTRQIGFYERHGYQDAVPMYLCIPSRYLMAAHLQQERSAEHNVAKCAV